MAITEPFGPRLRALRVAKGLSLSEFARRLYYSKGHVSRIETGAAQPTVEFARRCDNELAANGELARLVAGPRPPEASEPEPDHDDDGVWIMTMSPNGASELVPLGRRDVLVGGAALLAGVATGARRTEATGDAQPDARLEQHAQLLATTRELGQVSHPRAMLPVLTGQAQALRLLAGEFSGDGARAVAALSARTAEFASWMAQESGDDRLAMWWIRRAVRAGAAVGDTHTARYALVRQALLALHRGDAPTTIELARRAGRSGSDTPPRILGLAAQREAQGHALAGSRTECLRALDIARDHLAVAATQRSAAPVIGTSHVPDPVAAVTGWCLYELGDPASAAEVLRQELTRIPPTAVRARLRFGTRQALAHAAAGEVDHACVLTRDLLTKAATVHSATVRVDLSRLAGTFRRYRSHPKVRALAPAFAAALCPDRYARPRLVPMAQPGFGGSAARGE